MTSGKHVHFVGIGGVGMSGIAKVLLRLGYSVSGSDSKESAELENLRGLGAEIFVGHHASHVRDAEAVVYSSAITIDNPEVAQARRRKIPLIARGEMLAELMRKKQSIVIAGAHGKTTTTALVTTILSSCGFDPTAVVGGRLRSLGSNAKMGTDDWFVCESDESDGSFLKLFPTVAVVTNIDREHLNHYGSFEKIEEAFLDFSNRVPFDGVVVVCADDPYAAKLIDQSRRTVKTYGMEAKADLMAKNLKISADGSEFEVLLKGKKLGRVKLPLQGRHNVLNALASISVAIHLEIPFRKIAAAVSKFAGIERRLEVKGEASGVKVIDDYAHHPTEIRASVDALRQMAGSHAVRVLFQPHRFTRVKDLWERFVTAFDGVDDLVLAPIYAASESSIAGIDSEKLARAISANRNMLVEAVVNLEKGCERILERAKPGDLLVTMGAGDVTKCATILLNRLKRNKVLEVVR